MAKKDAPTPTPEQQERYRQHMALQEIKSWLATQAHEQFQQMQNATDAAAYQAADARYMAIKAMHRAIRDETPGDPAAWMAVVLAEMQAQAEHTMVLIGQMRDMMAGASDA